MGKSCMHINHASHSPAGKGLVRLCKLNVTCLRMLHCHDRKDRCCWPHACCFDSAWHPQRCAMPRTAAQIESNNVYVRTSQATRCKTANSATTYDLRSHLSGWLAILALLLHKGQQEAVRMQRVYVGHEVSRGHLTAQAAHMRRPHM